MVLKLAMPQVVQESKQDTPTNSKMCVDTRIPSSSCQILVFPGEDNNKEDHIEAIQNQNTNLLKLRRKVIFLLSFFFFFINFLVFTNIDFFVYIIKNE